VLLVWLLPKIIYAHRLPSAFGTIWAYFLPSSFDYMDFLNASEKTSSLDNSDAGGTADSLGA
jgi:hypothetical protein